MDVGLVLNPQGKIDMQLGRLFILVRLSITLMAHLTVRRQNSPVHDEKISTVFVHVICAPTYFAHPNF
jgi:hypothetical protein